MNLRILLFSYLFFQSFSTFAQQGDSISSYKENGLVFMYYRVGAGEELVDIARRYGFTFEEFLENNLGSGPVIRPGQQVVLPYRQELMPKGRPVFHKVEKGDTYFALSKRFGVPTAQLQRWNPQGLRAGEMAVIDYEEEESDVLSDIQNPRSKPVENTRTERMDGIVPNESGLPRVLIVPFDPRLYFSDADLDISQRTRVPAQQVRYAFRKRLNILLEPQGFDVLHMLGGKVSDSISELNRFYSGVSYETVQPLTPMLAPQGAVSDQTETNRKGLSETLNSFVSPEKKQTLAKEDSRHIGATVKDPGLFPHLQQRYLADYVIFVNQFEIHTDYEHCLDRARKDYERNFVAHYTIFNKAGERLAGDRIKVEYHSNENDLYKILEQNLPKIASQVMAQLPPPR
jgi:LysM repeat protein